MQVVTNENMVEFIQNRSVPEFKPPTEAKVDIKPDAPVNAVDTAKPAVEAKVESDKPAAPRGEDGKFVKADAPAKAEADAAGKAPEAAKPEDAGKVESESDADVKLTQKIERLINKKHRAMKEAQEFGADEARRAIAAEQRAEALQRQIDELKGTKSQGASPAGDEPKPEDFKTVGEYTRALVKYEATQAGKQNAQTAAQQRQQSEANAMIRAHVERQDTFKKATPDYEEVVGSSDLEVPPVGMQFLIESDVGPQLAYHLAKHPDEVTRLQKLSPSRVLAELGKLETRFEKSAAPAMAAAAPSPVSRAPAPIQPLEAKSTPVTKDPKDMNFQELRAHREAERRSKRA